MGSIKRDEAAGDTPKQNRREALKKFGRYAAAAPTAMVLLQARVSRADPPKPRGWYKGRGHDKGGFHEPY